MRKKTMDVYSSIFDFWNPEHLVKWVQRDGEEKTVHKDDHPFLEMAYKSEKVPTFKVGARPPTPWDGPLQKAKVVICYANPIYDSNDLKYLEIIRKQLDGRQNLPVVEPDLIPHWRDWYKPRFRSIYDTDDRLDKLKSDLAVFNICPYASDNMDEPNGRIAAGLPSAWMAQKHLREVLIPAAKARKIFLVIARAHTRWGVTAGFCNDATIRLESSRYGRITDETGRAIEEFLKTRAAD